MPRAVLFLNRAAGRRAATRRDAVRDLLAPHLDLRLHELAPGRVREQVAAALEPLPDLAIAMGGDGTVSAVTSVVRGTSTPLAVIPAGTANSVARALGIPLVLEDAVDLVLRGHVRTIDTGRVELEGRARPRTLILAATVGFHADAVAGAPRDWKRRWGALAYLASGLREILAFEPFDVELETERHRIACRVASVAVANLAPPLSLWAQGPPDVRGDDGLLDVTIVAADSAIQAIATSLHLARAGVAHEEATRDNVAWLRCRRLALRTRPAKRISIDGEAVGAGALRVECAPSSLAIVAPEPAPAEAPVEAELTSLDAEPV